MRLRSRSPLLAAAAAFALGALLWAATPATAPPLDLASDLPPGALMTLESQDFAALLSSWRHSPEQRAWLGSANYSAFANSRLFSRLGDAQGAFTNAASTPLDSSFLQQIAGKESIFAWYDIGNLEFLYVTHLKHEQVAALSLLQQRSKFERRESAGTAFYIRTAASSQDATSVANTETTYPAPSQDLSQPRTVAFAVRGDWLLLATRQDLLANALQLMAFQGGSNAPAESQAAVGWYSAAAAAGPAQRGDLHMLLDLQSLTKTPQFRSYWIQRNVTDTRRYRAALVDLYREPGQFREERVLLPMAPATSSDDVDLGQLEALVPEHTGVYRAVAQPAPELVLSSLEEKLLNNTASTSGDPGQAPPPETAIPAAGTLGDLDVRIDAPQPAPEAPAETLVPLRHMLDAAQIQSMLTLEGTDLPDPEVPFVHVHSAVVLRAAVPWNRASLVDALNATLRPRLTTASLGLVWQPVPAGNGNALSLAGAQPLTLFVDGPVAILSNDQKLISEILTRRGRQLPPQSAQFIAAMRPGEERANFHRITTQLAQHASISEGVRPETAVQLFRDNLPSLVDTFSGLERQRILVRNDGPVVRQTVLYQWTRAPDTRP